MILIILIIFLIYLFINKKYKKNFSIINLIEGFNTDKLRFIPCSDNTDNIINNNYQLEHINDIGKENDILYKLYADDIDKMFIFPDCNIEPEYKFNKSYSGYFDRKIFSLDSLQQKLNDNHNKIKDELLYNDPFLLRHPNDLETKILYDYDEEFKKDFENYLDNNNTIHYSFNRGLKYTTCGDIDNKGNKYHCPYPYIFNFKNSNTLCTKNNEYCNNVCCTSP
ncbi:MAG: hypothetical protein CMG74_06690 [Candidatus Marinimicrobia bacterium]|nr:hypothetical protein [Candidatus Neomarinimicrobiota bacterium]|tara:strand:+ start:120 stop:788 length:669 start_codon:yes stop_codon:yes gene_type:complete